MIDIILLETYNICILQILLKKEPILLSVKSSMQRRTDLFSFNRGPLRPNYTSCCKTKKGLTIIIGQLGLV